MMWQPVSTPPEKSQYVLLAATHHGVPAALMGFCKVQGGVPHYRDVIYGGQGRQYTHWMPLPAHPLNNG